MAEELRAADTAKRAWDAGDFKLASRILSHLKELHPEFVLVQRGDGVICKVTGTEPRSGEPILEAL